MFGCFGSSRFRKRCEREVKHIKMRCVPIKKKKESNISYLKQVIATLLASRLKDDVFRKMDALLYEINHKACYDMIEKFCDFFLSQLPNLQKPREISPEIQESMATIVYAAARFQDLSELRCLRLVFIKRYQDQIDTNSSINREFVEKFETKSFSNEQKLQLLQIIAEEFSVSWDLQDSDHKQSIIPSADSVEIKKAGASQGVDGSNFPTQLDGVKDKEGCSDDTLTCTKRLEHSEPKILSPYQINRAFPSYKIPPYVRAKSRVSPHVDDSDKFTKNEDKYL